MSKCRYRVQSRIDTSRFAREGEKKLSIQSLGRSSWGESDEVCAKSSELERA